MDSRPRPNVYRTPEALGRAIKDDLASYQPLHAVIREAEQRRQARMETQTQASA